MVSGWCPCVPLGRRESPDQQQSASSSRSFGNDGAPFTVSAATDHAEMVQMFYYENRGKCCKKLLRYNGYPNKVQHSGENGGHGNGHALHYRLFQENDERSRFQVVPDVERVVERLQHGLQYDGYAGAWLQEDQLLPDDSLRGDSSTRLREGLRGSESHLVSVHTHALRVWGLRALHVEENGCQVLNSLCAALAHRSTAITRQKSLLLVRPWPHRASLDLALTLSRLSKKTTIATTKSINPMNEQTSKRANEQISSQRSERTKKQKSNVQGSV